MTPKLYVPVERPRRIQRQRTKGWRMPRGAVYVGRPTKWGNPFSVESLAEQYPTLSVAMCRALAVNEFRYDLRARQVLCPELEYPSEEEIRAELAGRDLACWCPLDEPCHADVLLELANGGDR